MPEISVSPFYAIGNYSIMLLLYENCVHAGAYGICTKISTYEIPLAHFSKHVIINYINLKFKVFDMQNICGVVI